MSLKRRALWLMAASCQLLTAKAVVWPEVSGVASRNKSSMGGKHMIVAAETWQPWFAIDEQPDGSLSYSGIMLDVLLYLSTSINFTYTLVRPPDGKWGVGDANGNWNGMLGMIKRREVDFALGPFGIIYEREKEACDFTYPVVIDYWTAIVPIKFEKDPWPFVRPFDWKVWLCLLVSTFLILVLMGSADLFYSGYAEWGKIAGFTLRTATMEPTEWFPNDHHYQRIFAAAWMMGIFILGTGYSGTLISILTVEDIRLPVDSVEDLVSGKTGSGWGVEDGSLMQQIGRAAPAGSAFAKMHAGATYGGTCYDFKEEIKAGEVPGSVCERVTIQKVLSDDFTETGKCNFYVASKDFLATSFAMAFQVDSPYLDEVNGWILHMLQMGFHEAYMAALMPNATNCHGIEAIKMSKDRESLALTMLQVSGLFSLCAIGLGCALLTFGAENLFYGLCTRPQLVMKQTRKSRRPRAAAHF